jgi:hypothetical protein
MSRERTPAGNILALARSRDEETKAVEETATSYMPTNIDLETWLPDVDSQEKQEVDSEGAASSPPTGNGGRDRREKSAPRPSGKADASAARRKRISLYLDDDVLTKIFRVSLEQHEQLSAATHRLILEALKVRGL